MTEKYFKITNAEENHHGFQYVDGLNVLKEPFQEEGSCVPGGLYFSNSNNILDFLSFGIYLREITLPIDDPEFKMVKDGTKWRANKIILGERRNLTDRSTWEYLYSLGAKYILFDSLKWASKNGALNIIELFVEKKNDLLLTYGCFMLCKASKYNHIKIVEYLIGMGIDVTNGVGISYASKYGHLEIIKILVENNSDFRVINNYAIRHASRNGHLEIVKYLTEKGADFRSENNYAIKSAAENGHLDVVKFLIEKGADFKIGNNYAVRWASYNGHLDVVKFLIEKGADIREAEQMALKNNRANVINFLTEYKKSRKAVQ